jgi:phenylalanyl-tRNA synthetase beta chain
MKVSLNWVRFLNDKYHCAAEPAPDGIGALAEKIGLQLGAVEEVIDLGKKYSGVVVVKVVSCVKHPNADKLSICLVDDAKFAKNVARNNEGYVEIVCGAANVKAGQLVAWIPPGSIVPSTFDKDPFIIEKREIRGATSNGMIASAKELGLGEDHSGILVIDEDIKPGTPLASAFGLDDYIIDIENKMFTHRPDLFGQLGIAREIAGIQSQTFKSPEWYKENATLQADGRNNGLKLEVKNEVPKLVPRFCAVAIKDVKVSESPTWLKVRLAAVGIRPINNIVDLTNFYMMETAQPLHAYDYDKLKTGILGIRLSKKGETLELLGGKQAKLDDGAVVITDGQKAIGLGGIMGGADTEVDKNTKNIILECASFDMNLTRKTAMRYGLFTDAATRFTKNQSARQNQAVITKTADDVLRIAGGRISGALVDDKHITIRENSVKTSTEFINSRLGLRLSTAQIKKLLENVEFKVEGIGEKLTITAPFWRTDIHIPEDIVEEVGRLYGYDKLPLELPTRDLTPAQKDSTLEFKSLLRQIMKQAGASEVLTYSFVHESLLKKAGQDPAKAYHMRNAISPDLQYYRLSLTPSLLEKVQPNIRNGFELFCLYEMGRAHVKGVNDDEKLPAELDRLSLVFAGRQSSGQSSYFYAKNFVEYLMSETGITGHKYKAMDDKLPLQWQQAAQPFEPERSAVIYIDDKIIGIVGEPAQKLKQSIKLPKQTAQAELDLQALIKHRSPVKYQPLNRFPELEQDFCLRSAVNTTYQELADFMFKGMSKLSAEHSYHFRIEPIDIFQKENDAKHKQTTWRIILWHQERTLTTGETNKLLDKLADLAKREINAERV